MPSSASDKLLDSSIMSRTSAKAPHIILDYKHLPVQPVFALAVPTMEEKIIDDRGDLWLILDNSGCPTIGEAEILRFKVCSRTIARNSPVFNKMLYGHFKESQQALDTEWTSTLFEEDAHDMENLLRLWHGDWKRSSLTRLPATFKSSRDEHAVIDTLYGLVTVADKYDCIESLEPFIEKWTRLTADVRSTNPQLLKKLVWIYYHLGLQPEYQAVITDLIKNIPPNETDDFEFFSEDEVELNEEELHEPAGLSNKIEELRFQMIKDLLTRTERLTRLSHTNVNQYCAHPDAPHEEKLECMTRLRTAIIPQLRLHNLWPIPEDPKKVTLTAVELERIVTRIRHSPGTIHGAKHDLSRHGGCFVRDQHGQEHVRRYSMRNGEAEGQRDTKVFSVEGYVYKVTGSEKKHFTSLAERLGLPAEEEAV